MKAPDPVQQSWFDALPGITWPDARRALHLAAGVMAWALMLLFVALTAYFIWWCALAAVLLRSLPASDGGLRPILALALVITAVLVVVVARFVSSPRAAVRVVVPGLAAGAAIAITWAFTSPDGALYIARQIAWGESDVKDYQKFPERTIGTGPSTFTFKESAARLSGTVEYTSGGDERSAELEEFLESTNTTSFIVIKDDALVYEGYFNGYERDSIVTSFSAAKSVTSALIGLAIDEGAIGSVNDPVVWYLPELRGKGFEDLTIRHLLSMSSAISFTPEDDVGLLGELTQFTDDGLSYSYPDLRSRALSVERDDEPIGASFNYNKYHPLLLGMILERTTHMPVAEYLQERIWEPLGMEYAASWSLDSEDSGFEKMESGLNGRAIDFAKFGQLFLHEGDWNGTRILSAGWVRESTSPDPEDTGTWRSNEGWKEAGGYYKYMWWGRLRAGSSYDFVAIGHLGQYIYVSPSANAIAVRFGKDTGGVDDWETTMADIVDMVE
jgi:CubicO group peptidase (beta-lactamase class C family)